MSQSTPNLKPDFTEVAASLLTESVALQRAAATTNGNVSSIPHSNLTHDTIFSPDLQDVWVNGLWAVSLTLTLSVALFSGLVKQWLNWYLRRITGTPKQIACTRQYRYMGLAAWGVSPIIESLSLVMSASLFLFLIGFILFLQSLDGAQGIRNAVIVLTSCNFLFYIVSGIIPVLKPQCPYKTSVSQSLNHLISIVKTMAIRVLSFVVNSYRQRNILTPIKGIKLNFSRKMPFSNITRSTQIAERKQNNITTRISPFITYTPARGLQLLFGTKDSWASLRSRS